MENNVIDTPNNVNGGTQPLPMSQELENLLYFIHNQLSRELPTLTIDLDYFILGVFTERKSAIFNRLNDSLVSSAIDAIYSAFYKTVSSKALTAIKSNRKTGLDPLLANILLMGEEEARKLNSENVSSEHVFLAILADNDENNKIKKIFNKAGLTYNILKTKIINDNISSNINNIVEKSNNPITEENENIKTSSLVSMDEKEIAKALGLPPNAKIKFISNVGNEEEAKNMIKALMNGNDIDIDNLDIIDHTSLPGFGKRKKGKNANINAYCTNLNTLAEQGKIEPLIGREKELNEIIRILGRKKKNNAILLGGEGVGKTAIGESLALKIVNGDVPDFLENKVLVSLDMTALMAGTTLRGMFEERVKGILDEIKADPSFILFMDNIGAILADKGKNDYEISAMLARSLENGEIQVIGTSDFASYRKTFDKDPSLARRFQKIVVEAPSINESLNILHGLKSVYEDFHHVAYDEDAITACVHLADRYIPERNLPDSAIDILDEIGALKGTIQEPIELKDLREEIKILNAKIKALSTEQRFEEADLYSKELIKVKKNYTNTKNKYIKNIKENPVQITKDDILEIISMKTNIPVNNLTADDKKKLIDMNDRIKSNVIGQDDAIDIICKALKRNRIGLHSGKCMYSAMMIGKTGTGKCVSGNTNVKIRNKKTGEIQILTINEFKNLVSSSSFSDK